MAHLSQEEQLKLITDLEIEMMADMYNRYDTDQSPGYAGCPMHHLRGNAILAGPVQYPLSDCDEILCR